MAIDTIGSALTSSTTAAAQNSNLSESDFIKLFLTELSYQDPLQPVDNREFLAQMAQFSNLEETQVTNDNTTNLVTLDSSGQALGLLNHTIQFNSQSGVSTAGTVSSISFSSSGASLTVTLSDGTTVTDVTMSQITLVNK